MNTSKIYRSITHIVNAYQDKLGHIKEIDFTLTPPIGGWSYSEVYSHIFDSSLLSLMALNKAAIGEGDRQATHFVVKLILLLGMLPPGKRYKVPSRLADRVKKISILAAQHFILDFELQLAKLFPLLEKADPKIKVKHPRLGYLNAVQWLKFIEIHLNHHLKQINRIEKSFQQSA